MAASILTQDLLAILLLAAKCDVNTSIADCLLTLEEFQANHHRHFGVSSNDLRVLFLFELKLKEPDFLSEEKDYLKRRAKQLEATTLQDTGPQILSFHDAYFNDEGSFFMEDDIRCGSAAQYEQGVKLKRALQEVFSANYHPQLVMGLLKEYGIDEGLLYTCSRPGESS